MRGGRDLASDGPDETRHFAGDRGRRYALRLADRHQVAIALAHAILPLPGNIAHRLRQVLDTVEEFAAHPRLSYSPMLGQLSGIFKLLPAPADQFRCC